MAERSDALFQSLRSQLVDLEIDGLDPSTITRESLLIEDLGMDSLLFVDLTVALEEILEIDEFPMQDWVDGQMESGAPLTVGALIDGCMQLTSNAGPAC